MREAPPPRRTLAGLPRLLRPPGRELLDEHRPAHQRRLRLHLDAHQRPARRGAHPRRRGLRRLAPDLPRRGVRRVQGGPRRPPPPSSPASCRCCARCSTRCASGTSGVEGFEADDVIATLTTRGRRAGPRGGHLHRRPRRLPARLRHRSPCSTPCAASPRCGGWTPPRSTEKYLVPPERYSDLAALVGETSDNLPGVPGVGPKTAAKWLGQYGDLAGVVAHVDEIKGKAGENLREHLDGVLRNRRLNRLVDDLELPLSVADLERQIVGPRGGAPASSTAWSSGCCATGCSRPSRSRRTRSRAASTSRARCFTADDLRGALRRRRRGPAGAARRASSSGHYRGGSGDAGAVALAGADGAHGLPRPHDADPASRRTSSRPGWPTPTAPRCCTTPRSSCRRCPPAG